MSQSANFPSIRPSLLLDFANARTLDPRVTFTRASTASYYDKDGVLRTAASDVPRFTFNPVTEESLGLLIEESRANLVLRSEEFDNAAWTVDQLTVSPNVIVAPDGTLSADKLVENTALSSRSIRQAVTGLTSGATLTFSVYLKSAERTTAILYINDNITSANRVQANLDLISGTVTATSNFGTFTGVAATISSVGNGWYRCSISGVATGVTAVQGRVFIGTGTYTGDGTSGLYLWGAQLEASAYPTSYIQTVAAQVTRAVDVASMTGANFSSWYNNAEGTLFIDALMVAAQASYFKGFASIFNNALPTTEVINIIVPSNSSVIRFSGAAGGSTQFSLQATVSLNEKFKLAGAYKTNDFAASINQVTPSTDTSGNLPVSVDKLNIGANGSGVPSSSTISKIAYYPLRLSDAQLQALTR